jgi:hypothetical protein
MNRESPIQVLPPDYATPSQRPPPSGLLDLIDLLIELQRVIPIHHPLMLDREDPVQIATPRPAGTPSLAPGPAPQSAG